MKNIPQGFVSTLLARKSLIDNAVQKALTHNHDIIANKYCNYVDMHNPKISDKPSFYKPQCKNQHLPQANVIKALARKAQSVYERYLISEQGRFLLKKAQEFEIPYDINNINFLELRDQVEEFEEVITKAEKYGIDWKSFGYDINAIEQEMLDLEQQENDYLDYVKNQFAFTRGCEA